MQAKTLQLRISTVVLVAAMLLGCIGLTPTSIQAQETGPRIMLPLIQMGQSSQSILDGPFADIPDPSNAETIDSGFELPESELSESELSESELVALGGSCYWGKGSGRISFTPGQGNFFTYDWVGGKDTSNCRDINIHVQVQKPWARECKVDVSILANNRRYDPHVAPNRWYAPVRGLWTSNWSGLVGVTGACGRTTVYWAS